MDQRLLLTDEVHLLKTKNFNKLQSKLKRNPLTDTKKTTGSAGTSLISADNFFINISWCYFCKLVCFVVEFVWKWV